MTQTTKSRKTTAQKSVQILSRIEFKSDSRKVVYICRSSNGNDTYETTLFDGKATGCKCVSRKPCYHMAGCEQKEAARNLVAEAEAIVTDVTASTTVDTEYEEWKRANGKPAWLSREAYCQEFSIY